MHIVLTGATGFIGRRLVPRLVDAGHQVLALGLPSPDAEPPTAVPLLPWDLTRDPPPRGSLAGADVLVHLGWAGIPRYQDPIHLEVNLPASLALCRAALDEGVERLLVAGTCMEYGLGEGPRHPDDPTHPLTPYAQAKDRLRKTLQSWQAHRPFTLQWARLFYMHGPGQHARSLMAQLDLAIDRGDPTFPMSSGLHARDYLHVDEVAARIQRVVEDPGLRGILNLCSGQPTTLRSLVDAHIQRRGARIQVLHGAWPDPVNEPFAFWGVPNT